MKKFIPYEKLSKKEKRRIDSACRRSWNGLNPVTRKTADPKAYNRRKARRMDEDSTPGLFYRLIAPSYDNNAKTRLIYG